MNFLRGLFDKVRQKVSKKLKKETEKLLKTLQKQFVTYLKNLFIMLFGSKCSKYCMKIIWSWTTCLRTRILQNRFTPFMRNNVSH